MTKLQEDYLTMSLTVTTVLQEDAAIWQDNVPFSGVVNMVDGLNDDITDYQSEQEKDNTGITEDKKKTRGLLEENTVLISSILSFFASSTSNANLQRQMNLQPSKLAHMPELTLIGIAKIVLQAGTGNLANAQPYGLTQAMVSNQQTYMDAFSKILNAPRVATTSTANATDRIEELLGELHNAIEEKMDKGIALFASHVDFYNQYKKARVIVHSASRHIAMMASFTDANGEPLQNVRIVIENGKEKVLRKSSPLGNIRVQNLLEGEHVMIVEKSGFEKQEIRFIVSSPETTKLVVVMK
jgi:hypothetical protein